MGRETPLRPLPPPGAQAEWERWVNTGPTAQERGRYLVQTPSPHPVNLLFSQSQGNTGGGLSHGLGRHTRA